VSRYQKGKTNLDFTEARDSEWQWQQLEHMQVCTSLQTDSYANTPPVSFLQAGCPSCRPTNSVGYANKRLKKSVANIADKADKPRDAQFQPCGACAESHVVNSDYNVHFDNQTHRFRVPFL